ncbi:heterokaryon incompatibility protein-domain-containing protein, partial [Rhexocercosporidium sp. MPI-PUGE-AT-0058]
LNNHPPYEALSYVWGDPNATVAVRLHDVERHVTVNLALALRYLRLPEETRAVWADAMCINQEDDIEKTHQVRQMRNIYLGVERVAVWLGEDVNGDAREILDLYGDGSELGTVYRRWYFGDKAAFWDTRNAVFYRPWWTRTWTLQEVIHDGPVQAYIGSHQIDFDELCTKFMSYIQYAYIIRGSDIPEQPTLAAAPQPSDDYTSLFLSSTIMTEIAPQIQSERQQRKRKPNEPGILEMSLVLFRYQQCTDVRDKIFAPLGMINQQSDSGSLVEHRSSKRNVYTVVMRQLLQVQDTNSMTCIQSPERPIATSDLPSWVVDWTTHQDVFSQFSYVHSSYFPS